MHYKCSINRDHIISISHSDNKEENFLLLDKIINSIIKRRGFKKDKPTIVIASDIDMTIVDSSHRRSSKNDGSLDLEFWFKNCISEKIKLDSLTPLGIEYVKFVDKMLKHNDLNVIFISSTSRNITNDDHEFLETHGLYFDLIIHRRVGDKSSTNILKKSHFDLIHSVCTKYNKVMYIYFEDEKECREVGNEYFVHVPDIMSKTFDPSLINDKSFENMLLELTKK